MTLADVSGLHVNMESLPATGDTLERNVPLIRLDSDDDLRVWSAPIHKSNAVAPPLKQSRILTVVLSVYTRGAPTSLCCYAAPPFIGEFYCSLPNPKQPVLSLACTQIMIKLIRPAIE